MDEETRKKIWKLINPNPLTIPILSVIFFVLYFLYK